MGFSPFPAKDAKAEVQKLDDLLKGIQRTSMETVTPFWSCARSFKRCVPTRIKK